MSRGEVRNFLLARIAEDEARAEYVRDYGDTGGIFSPERIIAECAAKRAIIEQATEATGLDMSVDGDRRVGPRDETVEPYCGDLILAALMSVYKDHSDYKQGWEL